MVHISWVGEHLYGALKPGWPAWKNKTALQHGSCTEWGNVTGCLVPKSLAGIHIDGYDHFVTDSIVFSSQTGVLAEGAALLLQGIHVWNGIPAWNGTGIWLRGSHYQGNTRTRLDGCYLDFNDLVQVHKRSPNNIGMIET